MHCTGYFQAKLVSFHPTVFCSCRCGHCRNLAPEYQKAAKALKGIVGVGAIDCDQEANKPLCGQYGIQGFPTIKVKTNLDRASIEYNSPSINLLSSMRSSPLFGSIWYLPQCIFLYLYSSTPYSFFCVERSTSMYVVYF